MNVLENYSTTKKYINIALPDKALQQLPGKDHDSPFMGLKSSDHSQNSIMKQWFIRAGIDNDNATYHTSRHSFAVNSLLAGVDIFTLRDLLSHSSVKATEVYARIVDSLTTKASIKINEYWND